MITMSDILNITCEVVKVDPAAVLVPKSTPGAKKSEIVMARQMSMAVAFENKLGTLYAVGRFHLRSHCDVIHAIKTVNNDILTDKVRREVKHIIDFNTLERIKYFGWMPEPDYMDDLLNGE